MNKPYQIYKDSGVEWIGEIPSHWNLVPCRAIVSNRDERNDNEKEKNYLSLMANRGIIPYKEKGDVGNKKPEDLSKCKIVKKGDLVINSMNYSIGSYGMSPYDGVCSPVYIVLNSNKRHIENRYALRIFENKSLQKHLAALGNGILAHRAAIKWDDIRNQYVPLPPLNEQRVILERLDKEIHRIDSLIYEKLEFIKLLKEKRQALISHVVTKGLDPNVEMKDSGVEWIGEIPKHWTTRKLKYSFESPMLYGANESANDDNPENPRFIRITDMNDDGSLKSHTFKSLPPSVAEPYMLKDGDVLLARSGATVGKSFIYRDSHGSACFAGYLIKASLDKKKMLPDFLYLYTNTHCYWEYIKGSQIQATIQNVSAEKYANMVIPFPPLEEQQEIVKKAYTATDRIKRLQKEVQESIELLKEHRSALISAAVTGKIDLRDKEVA